VFPSRSASILLARLYLSSPTRVPIPKPIFRDSLPVLPAPKAAALTAVGIFLLFGSLMAFLAGTTLVWPGTALDRMWLLNPPAYQRLAPLGKFAGIPFLTLSALLALAAIGWFHRRLWAWRLTVVIVAIQVLGGFVNLFLGHLPEAATGILIAGALLLYLLRPRVRSAFCHAERSEGPAFRRHQ